MRHLIASMTSEYYKIKDSARKGFLKYLEKVFSNVPGKENPKILDIGCGTGVPTIWLAENYGGTLTAIDTDNNALDWLKAKIIEKGLEDQITVMHVSFFDFKAEPCSFDLVLAEGFLNVVGFERGFVRVIEMITKGGYFVIHDEYRDHEAKCEFMRQQGCALIGSLLLDEKVWWNDYYGPLEREISSSEIHHRENVFKSDLKEIELYKLDPSPFRSVYYIVDKQ